MGRYLTPKPMVFEAQTKGALRMPCCKQCKVNFEITDADRAFFERTSPRFGETICLIPEPSHCPKCRWQRRMLFRNERNLYRRPCDLSGRPIVSAIAPTSPYKVYDQPEWWSDKWDGLSYGRDFDFSRTFTEQFRELTVEVPHISLFTTNCENSYYGNFILNSRNCYLTFGCTNSEDCLFGRFIIGCKDVVDSLSVYSSELCYECVACEKCYECHYSMNLRNCIECSFCEDCLSCTNCILCFGLYKAEYCILNQQVSKAEFEKYKASIYPLTNARVRELWQQLATLKEKLPRRGTHIYASEDCVGDMISNSTRCEFCFDIANCEDCAFISWSPNSKASRDATFTAPEGVQFCYEVCSTVASRCIATFLCWACDSAFYSMECHNCRDIFGCTGIRNKQFCIFNKQYSEAEYGRRVTEIVTHMRRTGEWGEFLHPSLSFFGYNETVATEYFPVTEDEANKHGWRWAKHVGSANCGAAAQAPTSAIDTVQPNICETVLSCRKTKQQYKIIPAQYKFLQKQGLPVPDLCPDERHRERLRRRSPRWVWPAKCAKTGRDTWSTYPPGGKEIIWSEESYVQEFYS